MQQCKHRHARTPFFAREGVKGSHPCSVTAQYPHSCIVCVVCMMQIFEGKELRLKQEYFLCAATLHVRCVCLCLSALWCTQLRTFLFLVLLLCVAASTTLTQILHFLLCCVCLGTNILLRVWQSKTGHCAPIQKHQDVQLCRCWRHPIFHASTTGQGSPQLVL